MQGDWWQRVVKAGGKHEDFVFIDPQFVVVDYYHTSPPCPEFSVANANRGEGLRERALALKCCEYIMLARPEFVSLENVYLYAKSESFGLIVETLKALGYGYNYWYFNFADIGVPQTRKRLFLMAQRDSVVSPRPEATHYNPNGKKSAGFLGSLFFKPWNGWYGAVADLLWSLPDSEFADWQKKRLPKEYRDLLIGAAVKAFLLSQDYGSPSTDKKRKLRVCQGNEPASTVKASGSGGRLHAFVMNEGNPNGNEKRKYRLDYEPIKTITGGGMAVRGFLMPGGNASGARPYVGEEPSPTVGDVNRVGNMARAFLVNGTANDNGRSVTVVGEQSPSFTVVSSSWKKFPRAGANGRVVRMTVRALARFQGFPDWYVFPRCSDKLRSRKIQRLTIGGVGMGELLPLDESGLLEEVVGTDDVLACRIIGNAVPPAVGEAVGRVFLR